MLCFLRYLLPPELLSLRIPDGIYHSEVFPLGNSEKLFFGWRGLSWDNVALDRAFGG